MFLSTANATHVNKNNANDIDFSQKMHCVCKQYMQNGSNNKKRSSKKNTKNKFIDLYVSQWTPKRQIQWLL